MFKFHTAVGVRTFLVSNISRFIVQYLPSPSLTSPQTPVRLEWPTSRQDWIDLMRRHLENHEAEKQKWLDTVTGLVTILNEVYIVVTGTSFQYMKSRARSVDDGYIISHIVQSSHFFFLHHMLKLIHVHPLYCISFKLTQ